MTDVLWHKRVENRPVAISHSVHLDDGRGAPLILTCRWPTVGSPSGVIVFCHGLGSSGQAYGILTDIWAAQGYIVVQPTFPDAIHVVARTTPSLGLDPETQDLSSWTSMPAVRAHMHGVLHDPKFWMKRIEIVSRIGDGMDRILAQIRPTKTALRWAITGHSFGAFTAQHLAGAEIDMPDHGPYRVRDDRYKAAIVLSGQGRDQQGLRDGSWDHMTGPVLTVTGTKDGGALGQDWRWKCEPYDFAPEGDKYLVVLDDADHYLGSFVPENRQRPEQLHALQSVTLAFLDAHVAGDDAAQRWLEQLGERIGDARVRYRYK